MFSNYAETFYTVNYLSTHIFSFGKKNLFFHLFCDSPLENSIYRHTQAQRFACLDLEKKPSRNFHELSKENKNS